MKGTYSLLCYTREATGREEANNEDIAYSMHLALRASETAEWEPLNENYGIFFAAGVPIQAATAESRRACVAAAHFVADPFDEAHPATDAVAYGAVMPGDRHHVEIPEEPVSVPPCGWPIRARRYPYRARRRAGWLRAIGVPVGRQRRSDLLHAAWTGDAAYRRWRQSSVCRIRRGCLPLCDFLDVERRQIVCRDRCRYCRRGRIRRADRYCGSCGNGGIKPFLRLQYSQCHSWQRDCRH